MSFELKRKSGSDRKKGGGEEREASDPELAAHGSQLVAKRETS
jgi:hypothetical protein